MILSRRITFKLPIGAQLDILSATTFELQTCEQLLQKPDDIGLVSDLWNVALQEYHNLGHERIQLSEPPPIDGSSDLTVGGTSGTTAFANTMQEFDDAGA